MPSGPRPVRRPPPAGPFLSLQGGTHLLLLLALGAAAWLKEQPLFWHNAGGFPPWTRELVGTLFYPLLGLEAVLLAAFTVTVVRLRPRHGRAAAAGLTLLWLGLCAVAGLVAANNLHNLIEGRPLHWHPAQPAP